MVRKYVVEMMMIKPAVFPAMLAVLFAASALPARADVPPPPDYVENCTVAKQQTATTECLECRAYYGASSRCQTMLAPYCFTKICKTYGASVWSDILCRTKGATAPVVPAEITGALSLATTPVPDLPDAGTCLPYASATDTSTVTITNTQTATTTATEPIAPTLTSTATDTATVAPTSSATNTATDTTTPPPEKKRDDSGCNVSARSSAIRALGPLTIVLAGLLLVARSRRGRRG
jgi:hypothetical protein